jgi:methyl-accepting chemotaxis protein
VTEMTGIMKKLADGDITIAVSGITRKDELGRMAEAVQVFKDPAIKKLKKKAEEEEAVKLWKKEDEERLAREKEAAHQDQIAIKNLASGLARLADGDLVTRIDTAFAPKTEKLRQTMQSIRTNIDAIHVGSGEISSATDDLSRRTEQQAASLEETAATLDEITATVRNTAQGAIHAREVVTGAKADADESGEVVRQASALHQVNTTLNQMDQVTQQNAAMVEETTAAAHMLNQESDELASLVGRFQTGGSDTEGRTTARAASRPVPAGRPALKTRASRSGGALRKPEPALVQNSQEESWEEF